MNGLEILQLLKNYQEKEMNCFSLWYNFSQDNPDDEDAKKYMSVYAQTYSLLSMIIDKIGEGM